MTNRDLGNSLRLALIAIHEKIEKASIEWVGLVNRRVEEVTPLDTSELLDSRYVMVEHPPRRTVIEVGFKADHAPLVHEWPSTVNWTTPGTGNKFLERPYFSRAQTWPRFVKSKVRI